MNGIYDDDDHKRASTELLNKYLLITT